MHVFSLFNKIISRTKNIDIDNLARLLLILKSPCFLRPRRVMVDNMKRYKLEKVVGCGGSSVVYLANSISSENDKKRIHPNSSPISRKVSRDMKTNLSLKESNQLHNGVSKMPTEEQKSLLLTNTEIVASIVTKNDTAEKISNCNLPILDSKPEYPGTPEQYYATHDSLSTAIEKPSVSGTSYVLKFSRDMFVLRNDLNMDKNLPEEYRIGWFFDTVFSYSSENEHASVFVPYQADLQDSKLYFIVGTLHIPLVRSIFYLSQMDKFKIPFELKHIPNLVDNLHAIHLTGKVHRDIRIDNILQKTKGKNMFVISDFGCMFNVGQNSEYIGTLETASQRVLYLLIHSVTSSFPFNTSDDFESLLKLIKIQFFNASVPARGESKSEYLKELFTFWSRDNDVCNLIKLKSDLEKMDYLKTFWSKSYSEIAFTNYKEMYSKADFEKYHGC